LTGRITTLDSLGLPRYSGIQIATRKDQKSSKVKIYGSQMFSVLICDTKNDHLLASISLVGPECMGSPLYHSVGSHQIFNVHDPCHLAKTTWSCSGFQEPEKALRTFGNNDGNHDWRFEATFDGSELSPMNSLKHEAGADFNPLILQPAGARAHIVARVAQASGMWGSQSLSLFLRFDHPKNLK